MKCLNERYHNHLKRELSRLKSSDDAWAQLEQHRAVVEELLCLDFERLRPDLEAMLDRQRRGGTPARDQVAMLRSVWLGVRLAEGRWNRWLRMLRQSTLYRVLIGLAPGDGPPSVASHYTFLRRVLARSDGRGERRAEWDSPSSMFTLEVSENGVRKRVDDDDSNRDDRCARQREALRHEMFGDGQSTLDDRLTDWIIRVGVVALVEGGVLKSALSLAVDGTVHKSHARGRGHGLAGEESETDDGEGMESKAEAAKTPPKAKVKYRRYSDPTACFRWSNGSKSLEFGHLGLGMVVRTSKDEDIPLGSAFANVHEGESPAAMRAMHVLLKRLAVHAPELKVKHVVADAGYDAAAMYQFLLERGLTPVIPLARALPPDIDLPRMADGTTPRCTGGEAMKRHDLQGGTLIWRCPAVRNQVQKVEGKRRTKWEFDAQRCPLGQPCSMVVERGWFLRQDLEENPRRNLPLSRDSKEWQELYDERTAVERVFSRQHQAVPDRTYRRQYLYQWAMAMHTLSIQASALTRRHCAALDAFWCAVGIDAPPRKSAA